MLLNFCRRIMRLNTALLLAAGWLMTTPPAHAQTFQVDFSRWSGVPLIKTKFGVYQTPFFFKSHSPAAFDMSPLLREAGVQDLRYEMGWGKPDTYAFDQISGRPSDPQIDFSRLDPFVDQIENAGVTPLFAMTYDPLPLKTGTEWQRWKDVPSDLAAWQQINRRYAQHYREKGLAAPFYEMWNEPDLPGDGSKVFFNGTPDDYAKVYRAGAAGIQAGAADARTGGPAIAWKSEYAKAILTDPLDFVSIHAYENYPAQLGDIMRGLVLDRPELPILLTEYASYTQYGPSAPVSRHPAAVLFFRDVKGLLTYTDTPKVYWAQWIDNDMGLITEDLHRKALFNAYKIYQTLLPVDRNAVTPDADNGVGSMASSDDHNAGVVIWNENALDKAVTVNLDRLPFRHGTAELSRIDATHASYIDDKTSENLTVETQWPLTSDATTWAGTVPAESVVFLRLSDGSGQSLLRPLHLGTFVRNLYWFPDRKSDAYADFDPHTSIARVGMGSHDRGVAQIGSLIANPARRWRVQVRKSGPFAAQDVNSLFGLRLDYGSQNGGYSKSVLWHDGSYHPSRTSVLPWGRGKAGVDDAHAWKERSTGAALLLDVAKEAPADWNHRLILTPILQNMGANSQARILLSPIP